jgi:DNA polymerase-1
MSLVPIVAEMEDHGVAFDWARMAVASAKAERFSVTQRREIMQRLSALLNKPIDINLASSAQVADVLYGQLGLKTTRLTAKSQKMSTDEKALAGLAKKHDMVRKILDWREIRKLIGSYLEKYPKDFNYAPDGRTHSSHNQVRVVSGRFSVLEPGYQQLPKKYYYKLDDGEEFNLKFRDFVVAGPDHYFIGFDYSQIELRVLAALSGEPALVRAYQNGDDVHALTGALLFKVALDEVTDEQRSKGKTFNFAVSYGQGVKALAESLGVSFEEAKVLNEKFFSLYSTVKAWKDKQILLGVQQGYTTSVFGRRHPIWELDSDSGAVRSTGERLCVNAPIQGNAADVCKIAMVRSSKAIKQRGLGDRVHLIMNIHDALIWEVHNSVSPQTVIDIVHPEVTFPVPGWPPLEVEWEVGKRWGSMVKLKLDTSSQIVLPARAAVA